MNVATFTKTGTKATIQAKLSKAVFEAEVKNHELIKQAYITYLANGRLNLAVTKKRGEVRGGGRKPWRQKGTGRARFGSTRNPIWRGGGIAFGPTGEENYKQKLNIKAKHQALRFALSLAAKESRIVVVETFECKDGRVKPTIALLNKIGAKGSILLVVSVKDVLVERATRNIPNIKVTQAKYLNVYDIVNADTIVVSQKALEMVNEWLGTEKKVIKK
ncbi:MAG TPA: 50S ribosomal protein L4 [Candidatus Saccharimonadales bacterium]|nr:50S ribosomal protein L4 [Candidatus Saccharimonadales bacterium]